MIPRYSLPEISALFTDEARFGAWLEIEILAVEAWARLGVVPDADARAVRERAGFDVDAINAREKITDHDVAAFVDVLAESAGPAGRWIHFGLTSSDVLDTALPLQLRAVGEIVVAGAHELRAALIARARRTTRWPRTFAASNTCSGRPRS